MGAVSRRWVRAQVDEAAAKALGRDAGLSQRLSPLLVSRGITESLDAERFLNPDLRNLPDPFQMKDLARASTRLAEAIKARHRVALYGDYDVDGVTSTALLATFLKAHGLTPRTYIPKRLSEGYGL